METKRCVTCGKIKPITEFAIRKLNKDGYSGQCKECLKLYMGQWRKSNKEHRRDYAKKYKHNNPDKIIAKRKRHYERHKDKILKQTSEWQKKNPQKVKERNERWLKKHPGYSAFNTKRWRRNNRDRFNKWSRNYNKIPKKRIYHSMSANIKHCLKNKKNGYHWEDLVGYTVYDLKKYLESQFTDGMTWDNYGKWHIDHIKPVSWFNFTSYEDREFKQCWSLDNLQPLWAKDNLSKGNKYIG